AAISDSSRALHPPSPVGRHGRHYPPLTGRQACLNTTPSVPPLPTVIHLQRTRAISSVSTLFRVTSRASQLQVL
ncbi:hypothetical protein J6590_080875, partial [Homalodisca vitripennis]